MEEKQTYSKVIGQQISVALVLRRKKQKELAKALGVTDNTVSYFCSGSRKPTAEQVAKTAKFLDVSADYLLGLTDVPTNNAALQAVCKYTELSQNAVERLKSAECADTIISAESFDLLAMQLNKIKEIAPTLDKEAMDLEKFRAYNILLEMIDEVQK